MEFSWPDGATPIDPDEAAGLIPRWVTLQSELNAVEQDNVLKAHAWLQSQKRLDVLSEKFIKHLHQRMFDEVWRWAGGFRKTNKNIGTDWHAVPVALHQLTEDTRYWRDHKTYNWDEMGARFHHQLVSIHCFANGNGRHARLATDALMLAQGVEIFSWGANHAGDLVHTTSSRRRYIEALRLADKHNYAALIEFVRS